MVGREITGSHAWIRQQEATTEKGWDGDVAAFYFGLGGVAVVTIMLLWKAWRSDERLLVLERRLNEMERSQTEDKPCDS